VKIYIILLNGSKLHPKRSTTYDVSMVWSYILTYFVASRIDTKFPAGV